MSELLESEGLSPLSDKPKKSKKNKKNKKKKKNQVIEKEEKINEEIICDGCCYERDEPKVLNKIRYKCNECADYDLCEDCYQSRELFHPGHSFTKIEVKKSDKKVDIGNKVELIEPETNKQTKINQNQNQKNNQDNKNHIKIESLSFPQSIDIKKNENIKDRKKEKSNKIDNTKYKSIPIQSLFSKSPENKVVKSLNFSTPPQIKKTESIQQTMAQHLIQQQPVQISQQPVQVSQQQPIQIQEQTSQQLSQPPQIYIQQPIQPPQPQSQPQPEPQPSSQPQTQQIYQQSQQQSPSQQQKSNYNFHSADPMQYNSYLLDPQLQYGNTQYIDNSNLYQTPPGFKSYNLFDTSRLYNNGYMQLSNDHLMSEIIKEYPFLCDSGININHLCGTDLENLSYQQLDILQDYCFYLAKRISDLKVNKAMQLRNYQ